MVGRESTSTEPEVRGFLPVGEPSSTSMSSSCSSLALSTGSCQRGALPHIRHCTSWTRAAAAHSLDQYRCERSQLVWLGAAAQQHEQVATCASGACIGIPHCLHSASNFRPVRAWRGRFTHRVSPIESIVRLSIVRARVGVHRAGLEDQDCRTPGEAAVLASRSRRGRHLRRSSSSSLELKTPLRESRSRYQVGRAPPAAAARPR